MWNIDIDNIGQLYSRVIDQVGLNESELAKMISDERKTLKNEHGYRFPSVRYITEKYNITKYRYDYLTAKTKLIPELSKMHDEKIIGNTVAYNIARMSVEQQYFLYRYITENECKITVLKISQIREILCKADDFDVFVSKMNSIFKKNKLNGFFAFNIVLPWTQLFICAFLVSYIYLIKKFVDFVKECRAGKYDRGFKLLKIPDRFLYAVGLKNKKLSS